MNFTVHQTARCCWCRGPLALVPQARSSEWVLEAHYWCGNPPCRVRQAEWALSRTVKAGKQKLIEYLFVPLPKQVEFLSRHAPYKLYGGAAGPGKSHAMRWALYRLAQRIPNFRALLLRESYEELEQTHFADMEVEQELVGGRFIKGDHLMVWENKSRIIGGHMQDAKAIRRYLSTNYDVIACDEGSQYPCDDRKQPLLELSTRARSTKGAAKPLIGDGQFWVATNPGGPSAALLEDFFIRQTPDFEKYPALKKDYRPEEWQYIEALLDDNPYSSESYERKLAVLPAWRYQQLRHAQWGITEGQFFDEWNSGWHVRYLPVPSGGEWIEAMDWGYTAPGCVGWFVHLGDNRWHCAKEWKFQKHTPEDVALRMHQIRLELGIARPQYTVVDPAMFARTGQGFKGESIAETLARFGIPCRKGDNNRELGWARVHSWLRKRPDHDEPWLTFSPDCKYLNRSIPGLTSDEHNPEDVNTKLDDHGADMVRMFCMSRAPVAFGSGSAPKEAPKPGTWGAWKRFHRRAGERVGAIA